MSAEPAFLDPGKRQCPDCQQQMTLNWNLDRFGATPRFECHSCGTTEAI